MKQLTLIKILVLSSLLLSHVFVNSEELESISDVSIQKISAEYSVKLEILNDYVSSYDFKCPKILNIIQLKSLLADEFADNELNIMLESDRMDWRDTYLDARSDITCF